MKKPSTVDIVNQRSNGHHLVISLSPSLLKEDSEMEEIYYL